MAKKKGGGRAPRVLEDVSDSEDEEIPEDEAFNSEDERKYGSFFPSHDDSDSNASESDEDELDGDGIASEDDDPEGDGGDYMLRLLEELDSKQDHQHAGTPPAAHVSESEFASTVVKNAQLTLDALMEGLQDTKGFGVMQKTMKKISKGKTTAAPASKTVLDRTQRMVHYEHQTQEAARWIEAVQENRKAESLDFRHKERLGDVTKERLVEKFVPTTEFEKQLHAALEQAGLQDEEAILKREEELLRGKHGNDDDLGSSTLTIEEYKKRQGQLAKMRALMFYYEQKRHHMKKIKSKKYRRIRKRQRRRQEEAEMNARLEEDPDLAKELEEKEELERMKERMTLAHKNTSKWAKRILKRGKNVDLDTRRALSAQLQRGDDLRKKMTGIADKEDSDDDENEDVVETARKVLADSEGESDIPIHKESLFKLSFMQRGIKAQRERAKEEARQLLRELEDSQEQDYESAKRKNASQAKLSKKVPAASEAEMKDLISEGKLVASSLEFGNSNSIAVSGGIDIDLPSVSKDGNDEESKHKAATSEHSASFGISTTLEVVEQNSDEGVRAKKHSKSREAKTQTSDVESNPWMIPVGDTNHNRKAKKRRFGTVDKKAAVDVEAAVDVVDGNESQPILARESPSGAQEADVSEKPIASLTQEELVRRVFAAPSEKEVDEEFANEKSAVEDRDDPTRKRNEESKTVAGWGSWAGEGVPAPRTPRKLPKHLQPPKKKLKKRKRQDERKPNVIINEKRVKKTANQYQISEIPYPYTSREEYERAMIGGIGREWNVTSGVKNMTRPDIMTRAGKIIHPISRKVKQKRPAAKF